MIVLSNFLISKFQIIPTTTISLFLFIQLSVWDTSSLTNITMQLAVSYIILMDTPGFITVGRALDHSWLVPLTSFLLVTTAHAPRLCLVPNFCLLVELFNCFIAWRRKELILGRVEIT